MPLIDVTFGNKKVNPKRERKNPIILKIYSNSNHKTIGMLERIYDEAITDAVKDEGKLTWTKSGALFGHSSPRPKRDVDRLWERVTSCVGDGKECLMAVGAILRVKIAERPENWLVYKQETGEIDPITLKPIYVSNYWISPN